VWSSLAKFEVEFDANPLLLHINHFVRLVQLQNSTNMASQKCIENMRPHNRMPHGRVVCKGYGSLYLVACNCSTSGFRTAFLFWGLLGSTTYWNYHCLFVSPCQVTLQSTLEMSLHTEAMMHFSQTCIIIILFFIIYLYHSCPFQLMLEHVPKGEKLLLLVIYTFTSACQHPLYSIHSQ
jgi:hypothetical protein